MTAPRTIPSSLRPALEAYRAQLASRFGTRLHDVRLFGSRARGDGAPDSDVDVLVVVDQLTDRELGDALGDVAVPIITYNVPLTPLVLSTEKLQLMRDSERSLARALDEEGISV